MAPDKRSLRIGAAVVLCAVLLRLMSSGALGVAAQQLVGPEMAAFLVFLETGRVVKEPQPQVLPQPSTPTAPTEPTQPPKALAVFSDSDAALVDINNPKGYKVDVPALLQQSLTWDLTEGGPAVLILHSHATESYLKTEDYTESSAYRTKDIHYNVVSVGERIAQMLEAGGIGVIHDTTLHDQPSYSGAYSSARTQIQDYLTRYPSIRLVLDIHRDAATDAAGKQYGATVTVGEEESAKLMLVMGTNAGGSHPDWQENLSLAVKLHALLEKENPGICRSIALRSSRFNQDLSVGSLLVEVGAAGNTRQEALLAGEQLARAILELAYGTMV